MQDGYNEQGGGKTCNAFFLIVIFLLREMEPVWKRAQHLTPAILSLLATVDKLNQKEEQFALMSSELNQLKSNLTGKGDQLG